VAAPMYPPGVVAQGDSPSFGQDLGTMLSNPALLLGMAGVLAPQEALIGGNYWRIGPRLQGLGELFGAARGVNQEQQFGGQLQKLGQQGMLPPGQGQADPWNGMLPPGMDRQKFMSQLTPEMIRQIGANPQYGALVGQYAGAAEKNQQVALAAQGWYDQLRHLHPEPVARSMALAMSAQGKAPDEKLAMTPQSELESQVMRANAEKKIDTALVGGLDVGNIGQVKAFLAQNPDVSEQKLFSRSGNMPAAMAYASERIAKMNDILHAQGVHMGVKTILDPKTGESHLEIAEAPVPMTPVQIIKGVDELQRLVLEMQKTGLSSFAVQQLMLQLRAVREVPVAANYLKLDAGIIGAFETLSRAAGQRDAITETRVQAEQNRIDLQIQALERELATTGQYGKFKGKDSARMQREYPGEFAEAQSKQRQMQTLYEHRAAMSGVHDLHDIGRVSQIYGKRLADEQANIMGANVSHPSGKTWPQVEQELRLKKTPPDQILKLKQVFLSEQR
jgi:hypothetical protein